MTIDDKQLPVVESPFQMGSIEIPEIHFYGKNLVGRSAEVDLLFNVGATVVPASQRDGYLYAVLQFQLSCKIDGGNGERKDFIEILTAGRFRYSLKDADAKEAAVVFHKMLHLNGVSYLYGNLRPVVRMLTLNAGYDELVIPSFDVTKIFEDVQLDPETWVFPEGATDS